ncbi:lipocalin family protein [Hymenobacter sp. H14-R3]|uniref:lipocalin family protein n=1 Tax=Hymenobacter sp. H14-R3 TaxID=3046308 RepID=UPI0024BACC81|nr:lipocalin family protein [Hymenobacter sp. H14-R3]MDJ0367387.1 lipocalin family protein [Hymenobacter sp. H14-R3]
MKKLLFIFLLASSQLSTTSCAKKDDPAAAAPTNNQLILGRWDLAKRETTFSPTTSTFKDNSILYAKGDSYLTFETATVISYDKSISPTSGTYTISNNQLSTTSGGTTNAVQINQLTANQLVLQDSYVARSNANTNVTATNIYTYQR